MIEVHTLSRLSAAGCRSLKYEPETAVDVFGAGEEVVVRKTYQNRGRRLWWSFARRSRAQREHDHLVAIAAAGVPCLVPLGWSEWRHAGFVAYSTLWTRFVPDARPLKDVLKSLDPARDAEVRRRLAKAMGRLVALLHRRGILWFTPMPRNVMVLGDPRDARLLVADTPASVEVGRSVHGGALALVDLFLAAFSPSRRRDFTRGERLRWLHAYCEGERPLVRTLWQRLRSRHELHNELVRALTCCWFTYLLAPLRKRRGAASTLTRAT